MKQPLAESGPASLEEAGKILQFSEGRWDDLQKAGYIALQDFTWGGSYEIEKFRGKYWMSYVGAN